MTTTYKLNAKDALAFSERVWEEEIVPAIFDSVNCRETFAMPVDVCNAPLSVSPTTLISSMTAGEASSVMYVTSRQP